jgi:hypothetical protein
LATAAPMESPAPNTTARFPCSLFDMANTPSTLSPRGSSRLSPCPTAPWGWEHRERRR